MHFFQYIRRQTQFLPNTFAAKRYFWPFPGPREQLPFSAFRQSQQSSRNPAFLSGEIHFSYNKRRCNLPHICPAGYPLPQTSRHNSSANAKFSSTSINTNSVPGAASHCAWNPRRHCTGRFPVAAGSRQQQDNRLVFVSIFISFHIVSPLYQSLVITNSHCNRYQERNQCET